MKLPVLNPKRELPVSRHKEKLPEIATLAITIYSQLSLTNILT
ncbi:hypothetical protein bcere0002_50240 [Bacillus cereus ATCC 10876]|nr:hypothetical protein bcere0002_50240 [Bacillus cereus ATCC 10876]MDJ0294670.1 hypothetical protein [Bacillus bombysepticus]